MRRFSDVVTRIAMTIKIIPHDKGTPPGKLAEAELHNVGRNVTFPARQYSVNGEHRSFAVWRPVFDVAAQDRGSHPGGLHLTRVRGGRGRGAVMTAAARWVNRGYRQLQAGAVDWIGCPVCGTELVLELDCEVEERVLPPYRRAAGREPIVHRRTVPVAALCSGCEFATEVDYEKPDNDGR